MTRIPVIPETAPFDAMQRMWLNGFLAGLFSSDPSATPAPAATSLSLGPLLFLFGSQTGSSEGLARRFGKEARKLGFETRVVGMENYSTIDLTKEKRLIIITSTYGMGRCPIMHKSFGSTSGTEPLRVSSSWNFRS